MPSNFARIWKSNDLSDLVRVPVRLADFNKNSDFEKEAGELKEKLTAANDALATANSEAETAKASVAALSAQVSELTVSFFLVFRNIMKCFKANATEPAVDLSGEVAELKAQLESVQTELGVTNTALEAEKSKNTELTGSLEEAKAAGDATEALEAKLNELKSQFEAKETEVADAKSSLEQAQQELASANDKAEALEAQLNEAKNVSF